ncbi:MAG: Crp/Fnr family transcriptional regulator [Usitatibacter sp.]
MNHPTTNRLIARLPRQDMERVVASCERVELVFEDILVQPGKPIAHVYFPIDSFISLVTPIDSTCLEVALAGDEGMFGLPVSLGVATSNVRALVQGKGSALRMSARSFQRELAQCAALHQQMSRYTYVVMTQLAQSAACNRFHVVEQRLARWLLMTADRAHSESFHITHEFLAFMLGVRRAGVSQAASALQTGGLIQYTRGNLDILNRKGLERASCGCYRFDVGTYDRAFA